MKESNAYGHRQTLGERGLGRGREKAKKPKETKKETNKKSAAIRLI
jgi:hypothetical protein